MDNRDFIKYRYSPFSIDRKIRLEKVLSLLDNDLAKTEVQRYEYDGNVFTFYYSYNEWESDFFKFPSIHLKYLEYKNRMGLDAALNDFKLFIKNEFGHIANITIEIPSEDIDIIQSLTNGQFRLLETRLHYFNNDLKTFDYKRFDTRDANKDDIPNMKRIASEMRNEYDRFHADWSISNDIADEYLSTYIENSINGFADIVLVPNSTVAPSDSFLTANLNKDAWSILDYNISKMVLSAVSSTTNKGWYVKLISEMTYRLYQAGCQCVYMNTQSTNIAVFMVWQKLGYKLGRVTHILSFK